MLEEEDRKEIIALQEATHTSVIAFVLSLFVPFVGLILGIRAKSEIDKSEHTKSGAAFATAAIWIGAIGTLAWVALGTLILVVGVSGHGHDRGFGRGFGDRGYGHYQVQPDNANGGNLAGTLSQLLSGANGGSSNGGGSNLNSTQLAQELQQFLSGLGAGATSAVTTPPAPSKNG